MKNSTAQDEFAYNSDKFMTFQEFAIAFKNFMDAIAIYEVVGNKYKILFGNQKLFETIKLTKEETIGKYLREVVPGADIMGITEVLERVNKTGVSEHFPATIYKDKRIAGWFETFIVKLPSGNLMAIYNNKTKEKQLEQEMRSVIENSNDGYFNWDLNTGKVHFSDIYLKQLGYSREDFGNTFEEWEKKVHPADKERVAQTIKDFLEFKEGKKNIEIKFRLETKDNGFVDILSKAILITGPNGKPQTMQGIHVNISEQERIRRELQAKIKELERLNALMVNRELKMVQLKQHILKLETQNE